jgi:hypothetical protein
MTRRALLIGAQTFGLDGVEHDVEVMTVALAARGFADIRACQGPDATRDGIIDAYQRLIADTTAGDPVLVYYSGHGGYVRPLPGETVEVARNNRQFIVPTDFREPVGDDFRGITAVELSVLLGRLTERTRNAMVVLDCCHSALMSRDLGDLRARQLPRTVLVDLEAHVRRQLDAGLRIDLSRSVGNPDAVRVVACAADQSAYELPRRDRSGNYGVLTDALTTALAEAARTQPSWSRLMARVRQLVQEKIPHQRPEAEGPSERILFEVADDDRAGSLPVLAEDGNRVRLDGAPLLGVQVGDEFSVMPSSASAPALEGRIATVRIDRREPTAASGRLVFTVPGTTLPPDARAYRTRATSPRIPVRVPETLTAAAGRSTFVRVAGPGEDASIEVVSAGGALTVRDRIGPLHDPRHPGPDTTRRVVEDLDRVARATALRGIREEAGWTFAAPVTLEWGLVLDGEPHPLALSGASVDAGDLVYLKVRNDGTRTLYLSLVDVGVSYGITLLTDLAPSGVQLTAGGEYVFGRDDTTGRLTGAELTWPTGLDPGSARPETVLALLTSEPQDMSVLHQRGVRGAVQGLTPLTDLLAHFGAGATREFGRREVASRFCARSFEFTLVPSGRPAGERAFDLVPDGRAVRQNEV